MAKRAKNAGMFDSPYAEPRGLAIALRLPESVDTAIRSAAGWQSASKEDNALLRDWIEAACKDRLAATTSPAPVHEPSTIGYSIDQIRAAADRVAMTIQPRERLRVQKAFKALLGELLANGD